MKKILVLILVVSIIAMCFVGCKAEPLENTVNTTKAEAAQIVLKISRDSFAEDFSEIEFYEMLNNIEGAFYSKDNEKNEYTIQMTEQAYKALKELKSKDTLNSFSEIKGDTENFVTDFEYDEDFRNIKIIAEREKLPEQLNFLDNTIISVAGSALAYQLFTVEGQKLKLSVVCSDSDEIVFETEFPVVL